MGDSVSLKEEKQLLQEIQELKRNRPKVAMVNKKEADLQGMDHGLNMKESMGEINGNLNKLRDERRKVSDELTKLMQERNEQLGDLPQIVEKRDEISKQIQEQIKIRNGYRDEMRAADRAYNDYLAELRRIRQEKVNEERVARQEEYKKLRRQREAEKLDVQPYVSEMTLIEQTMLFCRSLTATKTEEKKEGEKQTVFNNPDGTEVLVKKEDRD